MKTPGRSSRIAAAAFLGAGLLCLATIVRAVAVDAGLGSSASQGAGSKAGAQDSARAKQGPTRAELRTAAERDPFQPDRQRPRAYRLPGESRGDVAPPPPPPPVGPQVDVLGTVARPGSKGGIALIQAQGGKPRFYAQGEMVMGFRLDSVGPNGAKFVNGEGYPFQLAITTTSNRMAREVMADWGTPARSLQLTVGESAIVTCPPSGQQMGTVWGSRVYTDDSSVCTAAVHAGVINFQTGGRATIRMLPGQQRYVGSQQNGVRTMDYGAFGRSFSISAASAPSSGRQQGPRADMPMIFRRPPISR